MNLEATMEALLVSEGLTPFTREVMFMRERKFRIDFAWQDLKVGIEVQGGQYVRGAHQRPKQYQSDCEKLNEAQLAGWILLWFTTDDIRKYTKRTINTLRRALVSRGWHGG